MAQEQGNADNPTQRDVDEPKASGEPAAPEDTTRKSRSKPARVGEMIEAMGAASLVDGDMAAAALVEGVAGSVLEAIGGDAAEEPSIARLRGLPWSYGGKEVCEFLANASPALAHLTSEAVTMLHNAAGEAFVTLSSSALLSEVLQANHQQIGRRYVEVFASTAAEKDAACERNRATMRDDAGYRGVLRMRGLPFQTTAEDILQFFQTPSTLQLSNIHLMRRADGRASGDAYAVFDTEEAAVEALQFDKQKLGSRWVDLFQSNKGELYSLTSLGGIMLGGDGANGGAQPQSALGEGFSVVKLRGLPWNVTIEDIHTFLSNIQVPAGGVHLMNGSNGRPSGLAYVELSTEDDQQEALRRDKQSIGGRYIDVFACTQTELQARLAGGLERGNHHHNGPNSADAHFVKLRGLPYQATEQQIAGFFQPLPVVAVQIAFNANGQPSGFGFVQLRTPDDASAALTRSNQVLGSRYVEVFRCSRSEMEQARMHALSVMPFMRGQHQMGGPGGHGRGGHNGHGHGRGPSESAYAAYQAAVQTLATRQHQGYATSGMPTGGYPTAGTYTGADAAAYANSASTMAAGSYGSYAAGTYDTSGAGYPQAGYGGAGYASASASGAGYGTVPASAGYATASASATQGSYYSQAAGANGAAAGYTAADYAQYSNYYYSPQTPTYQ